MMQSLRLVAPLLGALLLAGVAVPALAQVPQDTTFTGRLVDSLGNPLASPADLELRIFDATTGGTQLYSEQHLATALDATGGFTVQLGLGTSPSGTFDAALFSGVDRWLEVVVGPDVLTPRQIIGSVPWALIAQQANKVVPDTNGALEDCGDGTVADPKTGLQWEKKTGTLGSPIDCRVVGCPDPHDVNNVYNWGDPTNPIPTDDGGAFTDFLDKLNDQTFGEAATSSDVTGCFTGHCNWRLPTVVELQTIAVPVCCGLPWIDPIFGPTASSPYWTASTWATNPAGAWTVSFGSGNLVQIAGKGSSPSFVRAVRAGSCWTLQ